MLITCPYGLSSILNAELKRLWYTTYDTFDTGTYVDTTRWNKKLELEEHRQMVSHINTRSRVANKVYYPLLSQRNVRDFDTLFELISNVDWTKYIAIHTWIVVKIHNRQSTLSAERSVQSVIHKAIINKLTGDPDAVRDIDGEIPTIGIYVILNQDTLRVYINTTGKWLHNRGYRTQTGEAPIKENIAAALIYMSWRHWKTPLRDPCCGAGTIPIEAAMIARNIAPWLMRSCSYEQFPCFDIDIKVDIHNRAKEAQYVWKTFDLVGTDIDPDMIHIAQQNAINAWVSDTITFETKDIHDTMNDVYGTKISDCTIITNPPYDKRLETDDTWRIHKKIGETLTRKSVCITWYPTAMSHFHTRDWKHRKTKNGADMVTIYTSK